MAEHDDHDDHDGTGGTGGSSARTPAQEESHEVRRAVATGLAALLGVGLAVGLVLGGVALAVTRVAGVGDSGATSSASDTGSLYIPRFEDTGAPGGPEITLGGSATASATPSQSPSPTRSEKPDGDLTLNAGQTSVAPMGQIDLTGVFPTGEGAVLQVQRFAGGGWEDFPVTAVVSNQTFATYVQTSTPGVNRFRVLDPDSGTASNEVRVTVG